MKLYIPKGIEFPKELMSFAELEELGFRRRDLEAYSRVEDFPMIWTSGMGKRLVHTSDLLPWIQLYSERKKKQREKLGKTRFRNYVRYKKVV